MTLRKAVFWCHLTAGVSVGAVVLLMSATGLVLAFERQIVRWSSSHRAAPPAPGSPRLSAEELLASVRESRPDARPATITLRADPHAPVAVGLGRGTTLLVDPYDGRVLGQEAPRARAFFQTVTGWHRWLGASVDQRRLGRAVSGACNLAFLFLVLSGTCLWWPRSWSRRALAGSVVFRRGLAGKARDFNWHNVVGFWSAVPLFVVVLSAVVLSYPWAGDLIYRLTGEDPPPRRTSAPAERGPARAPRLDGLNAAWARAEQQVPGWQVIIARLPASPDEPVVFTLDTSSGAVRPDKRGQLSVDLKTGAVLRWEPYASQTTGRRVRAWVRWLHTGEAGGLPGQAIAAAASFGAVLLVWTGLALAWRRGTAAVRARRPRPAASAAIG